ncbi:JmjC domain-containing protein [Streptomyces sp. NPDC050560]|uniref:JmjC domain-containing protein n=1 Tax=Streptomyces sp. NPDC050560 TaxID=3365630 RepID=UPI0037AF78D3
MTYAAPSMDGTAAGPGGHDTLRQLFPEASRRGAPQEHWTSGRPLVEHGDPKDLEERIAERFPTPEALADFDPDMMVSVYGFRDAAGTEGSAGTTGQQQDLHTFPPTTISDAVPLYHAGHTLVCWRMLKNLPEAIERSWGILEAIGLPHQPVAARGLPEPWSNPRPLVLSMVYSPSGSGSGLGMHFDRFDSVVVHVRGHKRWRVGRHPHLEYPLYNEELAAKLDFPPSLPRVGLRTEFVTDLQEIEMRRGSVLLLPRGIYHTTLADDEASLSIGYHFALPTWSHVVLAALERRLTQDPFMRTTPIGAFPLAGPTPDARQRLAEAVEQTRAALESPETLLVDDLLGNLASHHQAAFRLVPGASARLLTAEPPVVLDYGGHGIDIELPAESAPLCSWLLDAAEWFMFDAALRAAEGRLSPRALWQLLQECVEAGLLERRWGLPAQ